MQNLVFARYVIEYKFSGLSLQGKKNGQYLLPVIKSELSVEN